MSHGITLGKLTSVYRENSAREWMSRKNGSDVYELGRLNSGEYQIDEKRKVK